MTAAQTEKTTYLWFDYETFGKDAVKDRPVQFGAVRTDDSFRVIEKPFVRYCQLADDYLPAPGACLVTGITPMSLLEQDNVLAESDFAAFINDQMSRPGTISIGFNSLKFDDTVTRFLFWRNLLSPYAREKGEGRGRFDIFPYVKAIYAFYPDVLNWPEKEDGSVSMKLEHLTKANGLTHQHAHDASSDAVATMQLAKLLYERQPAMWRYALEMQPPEKVLELLSQSVPLLYVDPFTTHTRRGMRIIYPLLENPAKKGEWICWDLSEDPEQIWTLNAQEVHERTYVSAERIAQGVVPLPLVFVRANQQPFVTKGLGWIDGRGKGLFDHNAAFYRNRARQIADKQAELPKLKGIFLEQADYKRSKFEKSVVIPEEHLYFNPVGWGDKDKMAEFRRLSPQEMADRFPRLDFEKDEIEKLTLYFMARNWPEVTLDAETSEIWSRYKKEKLVNGYGGARTFRAFFEELQQLQAEYADDEVKLQILEEVQEYGECLLAEYQG